jgi:pimeloyl-ACP methyl ester carboxylesterase
MFVQVNGAKLFFDVEGAGLVPDGPRMREKPTLLLLHGGPGFDHSIYKPAFSAVADLAQVIYLDHRGCGRSSGDDPETWNLAQWGDDVRGFCDALGIERPIVLGTSFGGFVAQAYATRHPDHPAKLVLVSTAAKMDFPAVFEAFGRIGGPEAKRIAEAHWLARTSATQVDYLRVCLPLYFARPLADGDMLGRAIIRNEVAMHFTGPVHEQGRMDFCTALGTVRCPVLVLAGERDPITPPVFSEEITHCLPSHLVRFERFPDCGHGVFADVPERAFVILREFLAPMTDGGAVPFGVPDV